MNLKYYYKILGVTENADTAAIKVRYRKLARKYHPDVSSETNAETKFKEISAAYAALITHKKQTEYVPPKATATRWESARFRSSSNRPARSFRIRGQDIHQKLSLFLEEAQRGGQQQITLRIPETAECGLIAHREKILNVKIPAGIMPGQRLRLAGQGGPGIDGGKPGDLFLEIEFTPHPHFRIEGKNILLTLPVTEWETTLGATVEVPTLSGKIKLKIPLGSSDGDKLRIKGEGLTGTPPGDQLVIINVVPTMHAIINSWRYDTL